MLYIDNVEDFYKFIHGSEEIILFRTGNEGWLTLELLKYTDSLKRICCIAQDRVDNFKNVAQKFDNFLPVIPFEHLLHFRESGIILVAAPVQLH